MVEESEYWNPQMETMRRNELEELQFKRIKSIITYAYRNSPFYNKMFRKARIKPEDIKTKEEFRSKIPLFRKDEVRDQRKETGDPFANILTIPPDQLAAVHPSTGTTGVPTFTALSADEISVVAEPCTRFGWMWKIRPGMRLLAGSMLDSFWHWWSTFLGACMCSKLGINSEIIGYNVYLHLLGFPISKVALGKFKADWTLLSQDAALMMITECARIGKEPKDIIPGLKYATSGGEAISPHSRETFLEKFGVLDWFDSWGCSDPFALASECYAHNGLHTFSDYWNFELTDPNTGEPLSPGERGELVITNLWMRSLPYIRFGTEDYGELREDECECGRTHPTARIFDRTSWVINVAGKMVSPFSLRLIMEKYPETRDASFNIVKYSHKMDTFRIKASYREDITKDPQELKNKLIVDIKEELGVDSQIDWVPYEKLEKLPHKVIRLVDLTKDK